MMELKKQTSILVTRSPRIQAPRLQQIGLMSLVSLMVGALLLVTAAITFVMWPQSLINEYFGWAGLACLQTSLLSWLARHRFAGNYDGSFQIRLRTIFLQVAALLILLQLNLSLWQVGWFEKASPGWPAPYFWELRNASSPVCIPFALYVNLSVASVLLIAMFWLSEGKRKQSI